MRPLISEVRARTGVLGGYQQLTVRPEDIVLVQVESVEAFRGWSPGHALLLNLSDLGLYFLAT